MFTPEQIQAYWDANPGSLEQAVTANPGMFGIGNIYNQNQAYNTSTGAPPANFDASINYSAGPNTFGGFEGQSFNDYLNQGTAGQQQTRTDNFNLGGTVQVRPDGTDATTTGTVPAELNQEVVQALNTAEQQYIDQMQEFIAGQGSAPAPVNTLGILESYGFPATIEQGGSTLKLNPVTGQYEGSKRPEDSMFASIVKQSPAIMSAFTGVPLVAAFGSGLTSATQGGDLEDVLKSAAQGGLTSYVGNDLFGGMTDSAVRSALEGAATTTVGQAFDGKFDLGDILTSAATSGAIKAGTDSVADYLDGSKYTDEFLKEQIAQGLISGDVIDGVITGGRAEELAKLHNTTDFGALFGENGFLNQTFGVGGERISTGLFDKAMQAIDPAISFLLDNPVGQSVANSPATKALLDGVSHLMGVETPTKEEVKEFMQNNYDLNPNNPDYDRERARLDSDIKESGFAFGPNEFLTDDEQYNEVLKLGTDPFREEFFEFNAPRSEDSPITGTHMENPFTSSSSSTSPTTTPSTSTNTGSSPEEPLPEKETSITQSIFDTIQDLLNSRGKMTEDDLEVDKDLTEGTVPGDPEDTLPPSDEEGPLGMWGVDYTIPQQGGTDDELPSSTTDDKLPPRDTDTPVTDSTGVVEPEMPPKETGTGGGGTSELPKPPTGMMGGDGDFKAFMSGISYVLPLIQQMGIPFEDFMKMWMNKR